jgi:hypothetical protein
MVRERHTFGCGTFLPGFGPFNFPEFGAGSPPTEDVVIPDDDTPVHSYIDAVKVPPAGPGDAGPGPTAPGPTDPGGPTPGPSTPTPGPPGPSAPGGPTPGPFTPGPFTPGPPGPSAPGGPGPDCTCTIQKGTPISPGPAQLAEGFNHGRRFTQKCIEHTPGNPPPNDPLWDKTLEEAQNSSKYEVTDSNGNTCGGTGEGTCGGDSALGNQSCKDANTGKCKCDDESCCPVITIWWSTLSLTKPEVGGGVILVDPTEEDDTDQPDFPDSAAGHVGVPKPDEEPGGIFNPSPGAPPVGVPKPPKPPGPPGGGFPATGPQVSTQKPFDEEEPPGTLLPPTGPPPVSTPKPPKPPEEPGGTLPGPGAGPQVGVPKPLPPEEPGGGVLDPGDDVRPPPPSPPRPPQEPGGGIVDPGGPQVGVPKPLPPEEPGGTLPGPGAGPQVGVPKPLPPEEPGGTLPGPGAGPQVGVPKPPKPPEEPGGGVLPGDVGVNTDSIKTKAIEDGIINLDDPFIQDVYSKNIPTGFMDPDIAIVGESTPSPVEDVVANDTGFSEIFSNQIHRSINYVVKNNNTAKDWDSVPVYSVQGQNIITSLNSEFLKTLRTIRKPDGESLSDKDIINIVGSRVIDGSLDKVDTQYLNNLALKTKKKDSVKIIRSSNESLNEVAVLNLIESSFIPLDPQNSTGKTSPIMENWKILATDTAKFISIKVGKNIKKYYIADDDTLIERSTLKIKDGDLYPLFHNGKVYNLPVGSEKNHAYIISPSVKRKALKLLGSEGKTRLTVNTAASSNIEFDYSLSSSRSNFYMLSCVLSSINTKPANKKSNLLHTTTASYELMDTSSTEGLNSVNDYIRYKANHKTFIIDDDDRILDYIENTSSLSMEQDDILFETSKTNPRIPLLNRNIPWYIVVYPTNRQEYLLYNSKSKIISYDPSGDVKRSLLFSPSLDPQFSTKSNKFIKISYGYPNYPDVSGNINTYSRISSIVPSSKVYQTGYRVKGVVGSAETLKPSRTKTTFRLLGEIIKELNTNYLLDDDGVGIGVNSFDIISRLRMTEFNKFVALENADLLFSVIKAGGIDNVRVYNPIKGAGKNAIKKTRIVQRKVGATADRYTSIKSMDTGFSIQPPSTEFNSSRFIPTKNPTKVTR